MAMKLLEITSQAIADSYIRVCWKNVSITTTKKDHSTSKEKNLRVKLALKHGKAVSKSTLPLS